MHTLSARNRLLVMTGIATLIPAALALWLGNIVAWPAAVIAPVWFGFSHAWIADPIALAVVAVVVLTAWTRKSWSALLYTVVGCVLVGLGFSPGGGVRSAIPYVGSISSIAPAATTPASPAIKLHVFNTGGLDAVGYGVVEGGHGKGVHDEPAFLIEHPSGTILFEAGFHPEIATDAASHIGGLVYYAGLLPMSQGKGQDAVSQLRSAGFDPAQVKAVIVSHFHPEHGGAVEEFANAEIVVDRREHDYAVANPAYNYLRNEYDNVARWRLLDFANTPAFGAFAGSIDFFGDGSVIVVSTPGHTPGHISLFLRLAEGPILLTGDIAWTEANIATESIGLPFISVDGDAHRRSLGQLLAFAHANPDALLAPGHDLAPLRRQSRTDVVIHTLP